MLGNLGAAASSTYQTSHISPAFSRFTSLLRLSTAFVFAATSSTPGWSTLLRGFFNKTDNANNAPSQPSTQPSTSPVIEHETANVSDETSCLLQSCCSAFWFCSTQSQQQTSDHTRLLTSMP